MIRVLAAAFACFLLFAACGTPAGIRHNDIPPLNGQNGAFDQATLDQATHRLYLADGTLGSIDVFDATGGQPRFLSSVKLGHAATSYPSHGL